MQGSEPLPIVAIVGRPNVGKSRLFNRYTGERRSLVDDVPGVTVDRIAAEVELEGRRFWLVDTAGLDPEAEQGLAESVQAQAEVALREADAILFVVDGRVGLLPEDEAIARTLRRSDKPLALAVNKLDQPGGEHARLAEFYRLGLDPVRAVSGEHGHGCFDLLEALVARLPEPEATTPASDDAVGVAVVGRPNVGKSSLVNRLLGNERLVVSDVPGTTRDSVDVRLEREEGAPIVLVDTAGLRRPGRRRGRTERGSALMTLRALERADVALLLIDAAEGFTDQDAHVARMLLERGCAVVALANKWDRVPKDEAKRVLEAIGHGLRFLPEVAVLPVSALTGARLGRLFPAVEAAAAAGRRRIATAELNRWLGDAVRIHEPSMARRGSNRRPIKFFFATQASVRPPTFVLFCTDPRAVQPAYRRYLENRLRESFDFRGTPVRLVLRRRSESDDAAPRGGAAA